MADYIELFHTMVVESQGPSYADNTENQPEHVFYLNVGQRVGILDGITLGFRTMAEAGYLPQEIYDQWHTFAYSKEMDDPQTFRKVIMDNRSNR